MTQSALLADQLRRAFEGEAWHGDSVLEILADVSATSAARRPIATAHSIWELVLHIAAWDAAVLKRSIGVAVQLSDAENFPPVTDISETAWQRTLAHLKDTHDRLEAGVAAFPDSRLHERVPGKSGDYYDFYYMFSGVCQHELYHAGQIALLKKG
jgi:uncharacterized damage-inducible protein DinB